VANVSVSKRLLIGVVAVAAVSLLALVFLLGRESRSGSVSAPLTRIERVAPRAQEGPPPLPTSAAVFITEHPETRPAPAPTPSTPVQSAARQATASQSPAPIGGERGSAGFDAERASVAAYFDAVDHIQAGAMSGEAESVGQEMATALAKGDTSGLDKMIRETEAAKQSLAAVAPPAPCAAHHRESLASLDDAMEVLRSLKTAMESSEPATQLASVSARATALHSRADTLQKEELALRERYGLKH
jgi:type IV secretory pathway VirB10-like protein